MKTLISNDSQQTYNIGHALGKHISQGICIALKGDLGVGKTTFVQGLARGLGVSEKYYITSPTYTIINEYPALNFTLYHLDLYRLGSAEELEYTGFDDILGSTSVIVVEWPKILKDTGFNFDLEIKFEFDHQYNRAISIFASGQPGLNLLENLVL